MLSEKPWRPDQVLLLLIRLFASMFAGVLLVSVLHSIHWLGAGGLDLVALIIGTVSFHGVAVVLMHRFIRDQGLTWEEAFGLGRPRLGRTLLLSLLVTCAIYPVVRCLQLLSVQVMEYLHLQPVVQSPVEVLQSAKALPMKLLIGFLAVLVAPFVEECVFRGLIYPTLKQYGFPRLALWGTSLLFALIHGNLVILLPLTFLAVVLTLLYETTDNLLAPILAHSLFNFANYLEVVLQPSGPVSFQAR